MNDHDQPSTSSDDTVPWEDIASAARQMFHVWMGSGEIEWVKECWQHFTNNGLTGNLTALDATATHLRLLALARIYEQFCGYAWEENPETPINYLAENLTIDPLALGIFAGRSAPQDFELEFDDDELREAALIAATDAMRDEIHTCLAEAYGGSVPLYSRMSATNRSAKRTGEGYEFEVTGSNCAALEFVTQGFRTYLP